MRILYTITKSEAGGAQTHVYQLAKYFHDRGHEVAIMANPGGWLEDKAREIGVNFYPNKYFSNSLDIFRGLAAMNRVFACVKDFKPDIIHCHSSAAGVWTRLAVLNAIPTVFTAHGWSFNEGVPVWQKFFGVISEKYCALFCTKIICVSEYVKNLALKFKIAPDNKLEVIYNGIEEFCPPEKNWNGKLKIVFVARMASPKDPESLISAYAAISSESKEKTELHLIGGGPLLNKAKALTKVLAIDPKITFYGELSREKVLEILGEMHIFALPTHWEGLPYTVLEAMALKNAVIASNVGGLSEAVSSDCGFLLPNDPFAWTGILEYLIRNPSKTQKLAEAASLKVKEKFSLAKSCSEIAKLYSIALEK